MTDDARAFSEATTCAPADGTRWAEIAAKVQAEMQIVHKDGVPWFEAPLPRWLHRCRVQTSGLSNLTRIERCACGATRLHGAGPWTGRNETRRNRRRQEEPAT